MARFDRMTVLARIMEPGIVPVFFSADLSVAKAIVNACAEGGAAVVEFTNRGEGALEVFQQLCEHAKSEHPELVLGTGSILDAPTAALFIAAGANFIVGPVLNAEVARLCNRRKIAYSPGCGSASEISAAEELGVEIVKIFPGAQVGGPAFVRAIRGPMPWTRIMPTGGVAFEQESVASWITAGAACVGMGSKLIDKASVASGEYEEIARRIRQVREWIAEARKS